MIRTLNLKYCVLIGIIIFAILLIVYIIMPRGKPVEIININPVFEIVKDGDIICRLGDRLWSRVFRDFSNDDNRFSHIGIIRVYNGQITVIHAEGTTSPGRDFVKEEPLADFLKIARKIGVYRIKDFDGSKISGLAMEYIGVPFDWQFDMYDESKLYCTELLYVILKQLIPTLELNKIYVKELGKNVIPIDAISNSEYFTEIYFVQAK